MAPLHSIMGGWPQPPLFSWPEASDHALYNPLIAFVGADFVVMVMVEIGSVQVSIMVVLVCDDPLPTTQEHCSLS